MCKQIVNRLEVWFYRNLVLLKGQKWIGNFQNQLFRWC